MIDVLGRTPALAQAVSRLLPFLTYGRKAAAGLLAEKFAEVGFVFIFFPSVKWCCFSFIRRDVVLSECACVMYTLLA